jgi:hypothetical protein
MLKGRKFPSNVVLINVPTGTKSRNCLVRMQLQYFLLVGDVFASFPEVYSFVLDDFSAPGQAVLFKKMVRGIVYVV